MQHIQKRNFLALQSVIIGCGVLFTPTIFANTNTLPQMVNPEQIARLFVTLLFVIGLIFACALFYRRFVLKRQPMGGALTIMHSLSMGHKQRLVLVRIQQHYLLLGITPNQITHLRAFSQEELEISESDMKEKHIKVNNSVFAKIQQSLLHSNNPQNLP